MLIYRADVGISPYNTNYRDAEGGVPYKYKFRFLSVTIIAHHLCTVNRNAVVLLTLHQKYYGVKLLYEYRG